ncbi:MAG: DEAD/DEAH box helicase, partial [Gammaproteobacteria bacterium]|nr:DEAD/DEAH box helicase [Gammaproteobacteria bacterium]
ASQGYTHPTPIQQQAIPVILEGRDVLAAAQTGTGKTAGFTLPLLQLLAGRKAEGKRPNQPRALILVPTRELAAQVGDSVTTYGKHLALRSSVIFGGVKINPQISALRQGVDILIATPGRLLDHVQQRTLDLSKIEILVLDEADRMLDMGFIHDIRKVLALLPAKRQNLLFSATFAGEIRTLADKLLDQPVSIDVAPRNTAAETVAQVVYPVDKARKRELLSYLIGANNWRQVLVFTRTKHGANRLAGQLEHDGLTAAAIHGNKSQGARTKALAGFKAGTVRVLVATDIAARGLDIDQLPHVVNYELPNVAEDYVHRIGRTGRAGNEGEAISLVCVDELKLLSDIERLLGRKIRSETLPGYEPDPSIAAEPIQNGRNRQQAGGRRDGGPSRGRPATTRSGQPRADNAARDRGKPAAGKRDGNTLRAESGDQRGNSAARKRPARSAGNAHANTPRHEANGNVARKPGNGGKPRSSDNGNRAPRSKPALLGG